MTATDELRRLLDERGVEWDVLQDDEGDEMTRWLDSTGRYVTALDYGETQYFADFYWGPTPQQAIEATLGRGMCKVEGSIDYGEFGCWQYELSCGCRILWPDSEPPMFCPECGARVVE